MTRRIGWRVLAASTAGALAVLTASTAFSGAASATSTGTLEICKQATGGLTGAYTFTVANAATPGRTLRTVSVAVGGCSAPLVLPTGAKVVKEAATAGSQVARVSVSPANRKISQSLGTRAVRVRVPAGGIAQETVVTFTNQPVGGTVGQLKICKEAADNSGTLVGQGFSFRVNGSAAFTVSAGAQGSPNCSALRSYAVGTSVSISELAAAGTFVSAITGATTTDLAARTAGLTIAAGVQAVVFRNQVSPVSQTGFVEVCKEALDGFTTGSFGFVVQPQGGSALTRSVTVGQCTDPIKVPAGPVTVTEAARANTEVGAVDVSPAGREISRNLVNRTVTVTVPVSDSATEETQVTFSNRTVLTQLKVCKALTAGSADLSGSTFGFDVTTAAGTTTGFSIVAGDAGETVCRVLPTRVPVGSPFSVRESGTPNVQVTGVTVDAATGSGSGGALGSGGSATGTLASGVNTVTFTNQAFGTLEVCKVAAAGDTSVTGSFSFSVNGADPITVQVGQCSPLLRVPAGTATVRELDRAHFTLVSVTATGPTGGSRLVSGTNPVTVSVPFGGAANETQVTFTNRTDTASLKICKQTNFPSLVTGSFVLDFRIDVGGVAGTGDSVSLAPGQCQVVATGIPVVGPNGVATDARVQEHTSATSTLTDLTYEGGGAVTNRDLSTRSALATLGEGVNVFTFTNDPNPS